MYKMTYILEIQRFYYDWSSKYQEVHPKSWKVGYMDKLFDSRQEASDYYDKFNPHMRSLNTFNTWISEFDPETRLGYIVKEYTNQVLTIPPFEDPSKA
jgi:hypothetical protein